MNLRICILNTGRLTHVQQNTVTDQGLRKTLAQGTRLFT